MADLMLIQYKCSFCIHLDHIAKGINIYSKKYQNILLMGYFKV